MNDQLAQMLNNQAQAAAQTVQIPVEAPCPLEGTNFADAQLIMQALSALPYAQVGVTIRRLEAMVNQAGRNWLEGTRPKAAEPLDVTVTPSSYDEARKLLEEAEAHRRDGDGTLAAVMCAPEDDYAASTILISQGMHHLDESLPNGQRGRTLAAYRALAYGVESLRRYLQKAT